MNKELVKKIEDEINAWFTDKMHHLDLEAARAESKRQGLFEGKKMAITIMYEMLSDEEEN